MGLDHFTSKTLAALEKKTLYADLWDPM